MRRRDDGSGHLPSLPALLSAYGVGVDRSTVAGSTAPAVAG